MASIVKIEAQTAEVEQTIVRLQTWGGSEQLRKVFESVGKALQSRILLCFRMGVSPWGESWKPLRYREGQPLQDTGRLRNSLTVRATDDDVQIGTNLKHNGVSYPAVMQFGAVIRPRKGKVLVFHIGSRTIFAKKVVVPARPYLPIRPNGETDLPKSWANAALKKFREGLNL